MTKSSSMATLLVVAVIALGLMAFVSFTGDVTGNVPRLGPSAGRDQFAAPIPDQTASLPRQAPDRTLVLDNDENGYVSEAYEQARLTHALFCEYIRRNPGSMPDARINYYC
ncbi:hypothetical protein COV18_01605 [Candidatus Woesearchaeota archaeon CG10_big_fil_rev_8_21_14_0_10_37_12]|nr:MAG: hypothetical protein COV18_01605 [Candidatus Woesearchaeota archaeon CG10_big_fil_rev_8_21_14_0_10_37_12]